LFTGKEALAIREGDLDYQGEMMLPFIVNAPTDDKVLRFAKGAKEDHRE